MFLAGPRREKVLLSGLSPWPVSSAGAGTWPAMNQRLPPSPTPALQPLPSRTHRRRTLMNLGANLTPAHFWLSSASVFLIRTSLGRTTGSFCPNQVLSFPIELWWLIKVTAIGWAQKFSHCWLYRLFCLILTMKPRKYVNQSSGKRNILPKVTWIVNEMREGQKLRSDWRKLYCLSLIRSLLQQELRKSHWPRSLSSWPLDLENTTFQKTTNK